MGQVPGGGDNSTLSLKHSPEIHTNICPANHWRLPLLLGLLLGRSFVAADSPQVPEQRLQFLQLLLVPLVNVEDVLGSNT